MAEKVIEILEDIATGLENRLAFTGSALSGLSEMDELLLNTIKTNINVAVHLLKEDKE